MAALAQEGGGLPPTEAAHPTVAVRSAPSVRVGLATDLSELAGVCCQAAELRLDGRTLIRGRPAVVRPAAGASQLGRYRVQVSALRDEAQAKTLAARLQTLLGQPADAVFDAGSNLYKVRFGSYRRREEAEAAKSELAELGQTGSWIVHEDRGIATAGLRLEIDGEVKRVRARWLEIAPTGRVVRFGKGAYRGRLLVYLNDRGALNVINELPIEDYLRGVVPTELGPELYPELEALKAQAVAARSYTVLNLGAFATEGYDICASPRCQVYRGVGAEHPLSDRAIAETAGEILLYQGTPVEALYSATCGGHTEHVEVVFPSKDADYLRGVTCLERGHFSLGSSATRTPLDHALAEQLLPAEPSAAPEPLGARLRQLAELAGLSVGHDRLSSLGRAEVLRFLLSTFDLILDPRLFQGPSQLERLIEDPPADLVAADLELAERLQELGLLETDSHALTPPEIDRLVVWMAERLDLLEEVAVHFRELREGELLLRMGRQELVLPLAERVATYYQPSLGPPRPAELDLLPGDPVVAFIAGGRVLAVVHRQPEQRLDRRAPLRPSWTRFRSDRELAKSVALRYPGFRFRSFEVVERGVSERVGKIRLHGVAEASIDVEGLAVRWLFEIPDTLFRAERVEGVEAGWRFVGRGRGHGVGLCQVGAFGMALRGLDYRQILGHYYTGTELGSTAIARDDMELSDRRAGDENVRSRAR